MSEKKPVRVWSCDRKLRYGIVADSWKNLKQKIDAKFSLSGKDFSLVMEEDGTAVDEKYWEAMEPHKRLLVLLQDDKWQPPPLPIPSLMNFSQNLSDTDTTDSAAQENPVIRMFIELQKNPAGIALFNLENLELIKDINLEKTLSEKSSYGLDKEFCKLVQDMSIELYVKRRNEADALEFVDLLKNHMAVGKK